LQVYLSLSGSSVRNGVLTADREAMNFPSRYSMVAIGRRKMRASAHDGRSRIDPMEHEVSQCGWRRCGYGDW